MAIESVYLLHGKGGSPNGTVSKLAALLEPRWPQLTFMRPLLPHSDPEVRAERSVEFLEQMHLPEGALLVGISLGGTVAAKLQETGRSDLHVMAISSPTWADGVVLHGRPDRRVAIYSSRDEVIAPRTAQWPRLAAYAYDFPWLNHNTGQHFAALTKLFGWYLDGTLADRLKDDPQKGTDLTLT